jgi:hypothetical protein
LLDKDWHVVVDHTLRKSNACAGAYNRRKLFPIIISSRADILAKMEANSIFPLVKFEVPPCELSSIFHTDTWGVVFVRE